MKKTTAVIAALAVSASLLAAPSASAQDNHVPPQTSLGSAYTGSAPFSLTLAALGIAATAKLITDNIPVVRETVDEIAVTLGSSDAFGSSDATRQQPFADFNLEELSSLSSTIQLPQ